MSRLSLNFAAEQRNLKAWTPTLGVAFLLAGLLALGFASWDYRQLVIEKSSLQDRRDALHQRTQRAHNITPITSELAAQVEQANAIFSLVQTPWATIFSALETARSKTPIGIALLSMKADTTKRELTLTGEAKDFSTLNSFTSALTDSAIFQNITLANDKLSTGNPPIVVTFDLRLTWLNDAPSH
jgi:Tfp pilus assembly protein PilN